MKVAVVAIHGVGKHEPGATARSVAALIGSGTPPRTPAYREEFITIPLTGTIPRAQNSSDPGIILSTSLTSGYEHELAPQRYDTVRFCLPKMDEKSEVHVYELYWTDLSRLAPGSWRILSEFYQLLFHLASLGQRVLKAAMEYEGPSLDKWSRRALVLAEKCVRGSFWLLAGPIFFAQLCLLLLYASAAVSFIPESIAVTGAEVLVALALVSAAALIRYARQPTLDVRLERIGWGLLAAVLVLLICEFLQWISWSYILVAFTTVGVTAILWWLVQAFSERRPELESWGVAFIVIAACGMLVACLVEQRYIKTPEAWASTGGLRITEILILVLRVCWTEKLSLDVVFGVTAALVVVTNWALDWIATHQKQVPSGVYQRSVALGAGSELRHRLSTALKTAALGTMLSTTAFVLVTLSIWGAIYVATKNTIGTRVLPYSGWLLPSGDVGAVGFARDLLETCSFYLPSAIGASALLLVALICAIAPSVLHEVLPPRAISERAASRLGTWLTNGLRGLAILIALAFLVYMGLGLSFIAIPSSPNEAAIRIGALIVGTTVGLIAVGDRLSETLGKVRVPLDILLDVDNYLRTHPQRQNPRSLIYARLHGLFTYVQELDYEKVVVVAHSQGTAIAADFLRLTQASPDRVKKIGAWSFLSLGCPLRQLYAAHFPDWYRWAKSNDGCLAPASLGLAHWINMYGAGDYVGRRVFQENDATDQFSQEIPAALPPAADVCVGALAHTHYLDGKAPLVNSVLRTLVSH